MRLKPVLVLAALLAAALDASAGDRVSVRWQSKTGTSAALPAGFPEPAHAVITAWEPFLKRAGFRVDADSAGRMLLLCSEKGGHADDLVAKLGKTSAWFDARFPALPESGAPKAAGPCAALFVLRNPEEYGQLLERLAELAPALADWTLDAKKDTGFVLTEPLCAAFLESAPGLKEWSPAHELVDRAAQLLLVQRFGEQPYWLQQGVAWAAEWGYDGSIWSYPYRREFVFAAEHGAWPNELKNEFVGRAQKPLEMSEFASMRRGRFDLERARLSFGCASFLALQPGAKVSQALADLQNFRDEDNRKPQADGTWLRDPAYEIPPAKQLELLEKQLGEKLMERVSAFVGKGADSFKALGRP